MQRTVIYLLQEKEIQVYIIVCNNLLVETGTTIIISIFAYFFSPWDFYREVNDIKFLYRV